MMNGRLGKDQMGNLTCRNASVVDYCLSNVNVLERLVDLEILEFPTLFSDVHTPFTLTLKKEHSPGEDADAGVIPNESSTEKVKKWEQEKSSIFQNNIDIDKLNFIISKLENVDQQNVNQNYINTLVTNIGQVLLDSAKQTFGVKLVNTNYSKKKKITKGDKPWFNIRAPDNFQDQRVITPYF